MTRIGIDTGGTFTDAVSEDGTLVKLRSSRNDPAAVIAAAVAMLAPHGPVDLVHGTTVATNAFLEHRLAPVGVLVNEGFRDLLLIGRQNRPELYDLEPSRPWRPTSSFLSLGVPGRLGKGGVELERFDPGACRRAAKTLVRRGARSLAVVFLHSYANPSSERAALRALKDLGVPVTLSSALNPEFREVERGDAALINAGLVPVAGRYLERLAAVLGPRARVRVMASDGGLLTPAHAAREPARLLLSGPAGGLVAGRRYAAAVGEPRVLTLDMGGTSTDVAWIGSELPRRPDLLLGGLKIRLPSLEIHTVGAGGGSLVLQDQGGGLRVGPESAGSDPGPAAYGKGTGVTVTDANLLLGRLAPAFFAAGEDALDLAHAERCARAAARAARVPYRDFVHGVIRLVDVTMARALRAISMEKGRDPRSAALMVFGGAGGLHGVALARALGMRRVVVPPEPGVLAARGLLWAAGARTLSKTVLLAIVPDAASRARLLLPLLEELTAAFEREGTPRSRLSASMTLDLRYRGQSFELEVPDGPDPARRFHALHAKRFGFADPSRPVELVAVRVRVEVASKLPALSRVPARRKGVPRPVFSLAPRGFRAPATPVFDRGLLAAGDRIDGPSILADRTGTTWLPRGSRARVHPTGTLLIDIKEAADGSST